jgi:DNA-binding beta-propeller fold protein YncE
MGRDGGRFLGPRSVAVDSRDNIYVVDYHNYRVQRFSSDGEFLTTWGSEGEWESQFKAASCIAVDSTGSVSVADMVTCFIQRFSSEGEFIDWWGGKGKDHGQFDRPCGIVVDGEDRIYVLDSGNCRVQIFSPKGEFTTARNIQECAPNAATAMTIDRAGSLYVVDAKEGCIRKFSSKGALLAQWGETGDGKGQFSKPSGLTVDSKGNVYVADTGNNRIQKFRPTKKPDPPKDE